MLDAAATHAGGQGILWYGDQFNNQYFIDRIISNPVLANSKLAGFDLCTFYYLVLRRNTQEYLHMMTLLFFRFVRSCPLEKHPQISK